MAFSYWPTNRTAWACDRSARATPSGDPSACSAASQALARNSAADGSDRLRRSISSATAVQSLVGAMGATGAWSNVIRNVRTRERRPDFRGTQSYGRGPTFPDLSLLTFATGPRRSANG